MKESIKAGDLVESLAGRDKGGIFLIIKTDGGYAYIVDGRKRKIKAPKRKKLKHLAIAKSDALPSEARVIAEGREFGNDRLKGLIARVQK